MTYIYRRVIIEGKHIYFCDLDGAEGVADVVENGADAEAQRDVNGEAQPVVAQVPVHVDKRPLGEHQGLRQEARLPLFLHHCSSLQK
jgi:hypothetical protein